MHAGDATIAPTSLLAEGGAPSILVVDDDTSIRRHLAVLLARAGGQVRVAASGEEALALLAAGPADLVFTDVEMPGISGLELLGRIRVGDPPPEVVVMTGHGLLDYAVRALKGQAIDFLSKPFESEQSVMAAFERALRHRTLLLENRRLQRSLAEANALLARQNLSLQDRLEDRTAELLRSMQRLAQLSLATVAALADAIEARDPYTGGHCHRVMFWSDIIGREMGLASEAEKLRYGALLHDVGKIGVPDHVLLKPGRLDGPEWEVMRSHVLIGERIVRAIPGMAETVGIVRHHHEMISGEGYPDRLSAEAIPICARIVGVVDAFDAMTTTRPYRVALPLEEAVRRLEEAKGWQFDPGVVDVFVNREIFRIRPTGPAHISVDEAAGTAAWAA